MMKKLAGLWTVVLSLVFAAAVFAQQLPMEMMVSNRYANVRKGPGSGYERVTTLYKGDRVLAERKFQNWLRVLIDDGNIGWVREDLIKPFDPEDRQLSNVQADSVNAVVQELAQQIDSLDARSRALLDQSRANQVLQDSLLALLGLDAVPERLDTLVYGNADTTAEGKPKLVSPFEPQETVIEVARGWMGRDLYNTRVGVLIYDNQTGISSGFSFARSFTPELSWRVELERAQFNPEQAVAPEGHVVRTAVTGGLGYSYRPGSLVVPYAQLGAGVLHSSWADSSSLDLDVSFGAGFRMYFTEDIAVDAAYRGHLITVAGKGAELFNGVSLGMGIQLPEFYPARYRWLELFYLTPFAGVQAFSPRFSIDAAPEAGMKLGWRMYDHFALELEGSYLQMKIRDRVGLLETGGARVGGQVLYYPLLMDKGFYLLAGGGSLLFTGDGRPPTGTKSYTYFNWGAGAKLRLSETFALRGEFSHQMFTDVARLVPEYEVGGASAVRIGGGINILF